jgi:hypothetical protein
MYQRVESEGGGMGYQRYSRIQRSWLYPPVVNLWIWLLESEMVWELRVTTWCFLLSVYSCLLWVTNRPVPQTNAVKCTQPNLATKGRVTLLLKIRGSRVETKLIVSIFAKYDISLSLKKFREIYHDNNLNIFLFSKTIAKIPIFGNAAIF